MNFLDYFKRVLLLNVYLFEGWYTTQQLFYGTKHDNDSQYQFIYDQLPCKKSQMV